MTTTSKPSIASIIFDIECFRDQSGELYAVSDGRLIEFDPSQIRGLIGSRYAKKYQEYPPRKDLDTAVDHLLHMAKSAEPRPVYIRSAPVRTPHGMPGVAVDLSNNESGYMLVTPDSIEYVPGASDRLAWFRRPDSSLALSSALPANLSELMPELQRLAPLPDTDSQIARLAFLLSCLWPVGPYPILSLVGPPESGKGFHARVIKELVDPSSSTLMGWPSREEELMLSAINCRLLVLDNISWCPPWASNALCRLSTGATFQKRKLYTTRTVVSQEVACPTIVTSVDPALTEPDLISRVTTIVLPPLPDHGRWDETDALDRVRKDAPFILHRLLQIVQVALLINPSEITQSSRITPMFRLMTAAEQALNWHPGTFERSYARIRSNGHDAVLGAHSWFEPLLGIVDANGGDWKGTASELLTALHRAVPTHLRGPDFPKSATALSRVLNSIQNSLMDVGVYIDPNIKRSRMGRVLHIARTRR